MNSTKVDDENQDRWKLMLSTVASQNNEGARLMLIPSNASSRKEQIKAAIRCFQNSLSILSETMGNDFDSGCLGFEKVLPSPISWMDVQGLEESGTLYVQEHVATIDPVIFNTKDGIGIVSIVLLFNLGIAFHALASNSGSKDVAIKAMRVYEMCAALVTETFDPIGIWDAMHFDAEVVAIAAKNNRAVLSYKIYDDAAHAIELMEEVCNSILTLPLRSTILSGPATIKTTEVFLNVFIMQYPKSVIAARAA